MRKDDGDAAECSSKVERKHEAAMRVDGEKRAGRRKRTCSEYALMRNKEGSKEEVTYGFGDEAIGLVTHTEHRFVGIHFVGV